jgi:hypothetical protein
MKVFEKANKYQETNSTKFPVISVVLLDEGDFIYFLVIDYFYLNYFFVLSLTYIYVIIF